MPPKASESGAGVATLAADVVQGCLCSVRAPVLGLATGGSVAGLYGELVRRHRLGDLSFAGVRAFLLDEYVGCPRTIRRPTAT